MAERAHPKDPGFKDRWFGFKKSIYRKRMFKRYKSCNSYINNKIVLDVPCGVGWGTSLLTCTKKLYGLDIDRGAIEYAKSHYKKIEFQVGSMAEVPFASESLDVVICLEGIEHVPKEIGVKFFEESLRVLKPFGLLILTCPILNDEGKCSGNPYHVYEYSEKEIINLLNKYYRFVLLERVQGPDGPEIRFVGQKIKQGDISTNP